MTKHILIVDDEPKVAFLLKESLESADQDYAVSQVQSAEAALSALAQAPCDLVVTDLRMPGMSGLDLLSRVRHERPSLPTILITAYGSDDVLAASRRLQTTRYFAKPFKVEEFLAAVQDVLTSTLEIDQSMGVAQVERVAARLQDLRYEVGAACAVLANTAGQLLVEIGSIDGAETAELAGFLRHSFDAPRAITQAWHEPRAFNLIYHEGARFDLYAADASAQLFVVLIFDRRLGPNRPGIVWLYLKRALLEMQTILKQE